jgi:hypothetical protein
LDLLPNYIEFYKNCFPSATRYSLPYLQWMYEDNPAGMATGIDAFCGDEVVGQVIAIPGEYIFRDNLVKGLLAVNVAVRPKFQGRHLFKKLGLRLCEHAANDGYGFIIGVANAPATLGWTRQMGFQLITPLDAMIGFGSLGIDGLDKVAESGELRHHWTSQTLKWRSENPVNPVSLKILPAGEAIRATAFAGIPGISAYAEIPLANLGAISFDATHGTGINPRVFLGLIPGHRFGFRYCSIPKRFKPSPLNLIYKNLQNSSDRIEKEMCFFNFLDFDAF